MAFSSLPSNFLSPPSTTSPPQSLFFILYHPNTHSSRISRAGKLNISCCQQTVHNEPNLSKNKKRKPRPSFLDQVHKKWSQKMPSLRENFPWQEQEIAETKQEFQDISSDVSSVREAQKSSRTSEPVRAHVEIKSNSTPAHVEIKKNSAPWVHGSAKRKVIISDSSRNSAENVGKETNVVHEHHRNEEKLDTVVASSDNLVKDVMRDDEIERKFREFAEAPIRLPQENENSDAERIRSAGVEKDPPTVWRNEGSVKSYAGGGGLNKLPWERVRVNSGEAVKNDKFRDKKTISAERSIPEHELKRLRSVSLRMVERIKVGAAGVTQALANEIHEKWKTEEVVKLKFEGAPAKNMKRTHEFLEVTAWF